MSVDRSHYPEMGGFNKGLSLCLHVLSLIAFAQALPTQSSEPLVTSAISNYTSVPVKPDEPVATVALDVNLHDIPERAGQSAGPFQSLGRSTYTQIIDPNQSISTSSPHISASGIWQNMSDIITHGQWPRRDIACTVTDQGTPDPFMQSSHGKYFLSFTSGDRVEIWSSHDLINFRNAAVNKTVIWRPPPHTDYSSDIWAPELHSINGRWYVYVACANPRLGNRSHRMYVLGGPSTDAEPTQGPWEFLGPIRNLPNSQWAIDATVFWIYNQLYYVYSGWPLEDHSGSDLVQLLYIVRLSDPTTAVGRPVLLSRPDYPWEKTGDHQINEGPQWLEDPSGSFSGIVYSASGSWTNEYKLGILKYLGGNPLSPDSWWKDPRPLLQTRNDMSPGCYGPGHCSFVTQGRDLIMIFHATDRPDEGWNNRRARAQKVYFNGGLPDMGGFVGHLYPNLDGPELPRIDDPSRPHERSQRPQQRKEDHHHGGVRATLKTMWQEMRDA